LLGAQRILMLSLFFERLLKTDRLFGVEEVKAYDIGAYLKIQQSWLQSAYFVPATRQNRRFT
ncbi:hypothetical protein ACVSUJ_19445, partial [Yersinia enterocolitica]